jgi:AcrR family transcriptional regulator
MQKLAGNCVGCKQLWHNAPVTDLPRYLQLLWGRESEGRRGPKPGRTIEQIGAAAVAIADRDGLSAVSMKSVADAIGLTPMSLYRYVDSKAELDAVMLDVALGKPDVEYAPDDDWRVRIDRWARTLADRRLAHPWMVQVDTRESPPLTPNTIAWEEAGLAALEGAPLDGAQRLSILLAVDGWALNHVRQSLQLGLMGEVRPDSPQGMYLEHIQELIDPAAFPRLAAAAGEALATYDMEYFEEEWRFGMGLLQDGIQALIDRRPVLGT